MRWVYLFAVNAIVFSGWFSSLLPARKRLPPAAERFLAACLCALAQIVATGILLGAFMSALTAPNIIGLNLLISLSLLTLSAVRGKLKAAVDEISLLMKDATRLVRQSAALKALVGIALIVICWNAFLIWTFPAVEWDSLTYHLPDVAFFYQNHSIKEVTGPTDPIMWINGYPKNIELLFFWAFIIPKDDRLVDAVQFAFAFMAVPAVYIAARKFALAPVHALTAALIVFLSPVVIMQSRTNYIDLAVATLMWATVAFLFNNERPYFLRYLAGGLALGLLVGSKYSGVPFALIVLAALTVSLTLGRRGEKVSAKHLFLALSTVALPILVLGGFWYLKNLAVYANPLWPFKLVVLGRTLLGNGIFTEAQINGPIVPDQLKPLSLLGRAFFVWRESGPGFRYDSFLSGLGPFWFVLGLPSLAFAAIDLVKKKKLRTAAPFLALILAFMIHPLNWWPRYSQFLIGVGAIAFVYMLQNKTSGGLRRIVVVVALWLVVYGVALSSTGAFFTPLTIKRWLAKPEKDRVTANLYRFNTKPVYASSPKGVLGDGLLGQAYRYINSHEPKGVNVSVSDKIITIYPLWGPRLTNRFYYFYPRTYAAWLRQLKDHKIRYLLVISKSREYDLINRHPGDFKLKYIDAEHAYAVYEPIKD